MSAGPPDSGRDARIHELEEALEARDRFIAVIGHELRNPMLPISLQAERLRAAAARGEQQGLEAGLARLHLAVERYLMRATVLLDVSRMLAGRLKLEPSAVEVVAVVRDAVDEIALVAARAGSTVVVEAAEAEIHARLDPMAFRQIMENLLSNAVKYGAGQPVTVSVAAASATVAIEVRDRGIGIAPADQTRVFDRFERAVSRAQHGGFGVGLWIVGQLVTAMRGDITLSSNPGEGATFRVVLPLLADEDSP